MENQTTCPDRKLLNEIYFWGPSSDEIAYAITPMVFDISSATVILVIMLC